MLQFSKIKVMSYNIHKGFSFGNFKYVLSEIKARIEETEADIVFLQEVGEQKDLGPQLEYLADNLWPHFAYGKNSVYEGGHHGNAILSRFPIQSNTNVSLTQYHLEKRGMLHAIISDDRGVKIHLLTVHLDLINYNRMKQLQIVTNYFKKNISPDDLVILGGDFNDWTEKASQILSATTQVKEAHSYLHKVHAKTFPSVFPLLPLDRMYFKNLEPLKAEVLKSKTWRNLSDHLALLTEFKVI